MPMYEKGSVRAEPRSKQQERMKKIMKKFLSSLLALTMILSLVIVPAQAHETPQGDPNPTPPADTLSWGSSPTITVKSGDNNVSTVEKGASLTFTVSDLAIKKGTADATSGTDYTAEYSWSGLPDGLSSSNSNTVSGTTNAAGTFNVKCTITIKQNNVAVENMQKEVSARVTVTDAQAAFEAAVKQATVTFKGRTYSFNNSTSVTIDKFSADSETLSAEDLRLNVTGYNSAVITKNVANWAVKSSSAADALSVSVTVNYTPVTGQTLSISGTGVTASGDNYAATVYSGQSLKLTASYARTGSKSVGYAWSSTTAGATLNNTDSQTSTFIAPDVNANTIYTVTCIAKEGSSESIRKTVTITVKPDPYSPSRNGEDATKTIATNNSASCTIAAPVLKSTNDTVYYQSSNTANFDITWAVKSGSNLINTPTKNSNGSATVTAKSSAKSGTAVVTATITYMGKQYPALDYTVDISALDVKLSSIVNGDSDSYRQSDIQDKLADAIKKQDSSFRYNNVNTITVVGTPSRVTLKDGKTTLSNGSSVTDGFTIYADEAYIGDASFQLKVNNNYVVTMYLTVDSKGEIKDTVTGTSAGKSVTFTNSDYDYLYIYEGSTSFKSDMYNGDWSRTSYAPRSWKPVAQNKDYTVSSSAFDRNGKATLYVVAVDDDIASTGTITVSQKSYDINYNVVAGKSVTFNQKDFESFLEDYAEDNGNYNSRKDEISFDHAVLTSSVPSAKSEGTLYYGSTEITSSNKSKTDMTDMDKVSFDSVSKPSKGTVTLTFKVYGDLYKNGSSKKTEVKYDVNVVISVVKEDITYTVGIDDTVQLTARDFVNFLQDAKTSYRKSTLDYVKFDVSGKNVSSYAYGGLYRSYSSYSTGKLADSTDKFYYEPSRTQYDLADVAYHTTRWAEAGKTIYIPFTVYGTKNEEASGTMAITIAQTMNFIDVKASDFFYEPVKWAVNNKITNGTSSTTFSPYKNCNRAEIVTFLWRAAGSPEPTVTRNPFTDVNSVRDASYYKAILWASQKGITAGINATTFSPYQECTRSQIVTFLYRYAGKPSGYYSNPFKDVSSVNEASYYNAILWAVGKGITQGTSTTTFSPYASCTRGEAVTFLYRYVNGVK